MKNVMTKETQRKPAPGAGLDSGRTLCTPSDFAKSSLLYVQEIGERSFPANVTCDREGLQSFLFIMVESGTGKITVGGETVKMEKGDCAFMDCRKPYSHSTGSNPWKLRWLHFYGTIMPAFAEYYASRGGRTVFRPSMPAQYRHRWETVMAICDSDGTLKEMGVNKELHILLAMLTADADHASSAVSGAGWRDRRMDAVWSFVTENYHRRVSLDELSEKFSVNKFTLVREFRRRFGMTIHRCVADVRVSHAKELLRFTRKSIEQIAGECGVDDANYFARTFKSIEGVTPYAYRRIWRG